MRRLLAILFALSLFIVVEVIVRIIGLPVKVQKAYISFRLKKVRREIKLSRESERRYEEIKNKYRYLKETNTVFTTFSNGIWKLNKNIIALVRDTFGSWCIYSNQFSFRSKKIDLKKKKNEVRIICLGDSVTFGLGVDNEDTYPYYLENFLQDKYKNKKIEVLNAGIPGFSSDQGLFLFKRNCLYLKPDLVLISFGINDYVRPLNQTIQKVKKRSFSNELVKSIVNGLNEFFMNFHFYRLLYFSKVIFSKNKNYGTKSKKIPIRTKLLDYRNNLLKMAMLAKSNNCEVIFLSEYSLPYTIGSLPRSGKYFKVMKEVAKSTNSYFLDVREKFKEIEEHNLERLVELFFDLCHPTPKGNKTLAKFIFDFIVQNRIIEKLPLKVNHFQLNVEPEKFNEPIIKNILKSNRK